MGDFLANFVLISEIFAISCSFGPEVDGLFDREVFRSNLWSESCDPFPAGTSLIVLCG